MSYTKNKLYAILVQNLAMRCENYPATACVSDVPRPLSS